MTTYALNRKARHDYSISETIEAGISLLGTEVKSIRAGHVQLKEAYARIDSNKNEAFLINCHISPYAQGNIHNHEPTRTRKLLLHKREILRLLGKTREKGLTLVPLRIYGKRGVIKLELGLGVGKFKVDRRHDIKEREHKIEMARAIKVKVR